MPVNFVLLLIVDMVIIFGNLYLYKFLQQNTDRRKKGRTYCMKEDQYLFAGLQCCKILMSRRREDAI